MTRDFTFQRRWNSDLHSQFTLRFRRLRVGRN